MKRNRIIASILAALLLLPLTGCRTLPKERTAAVLLVGYHDNSRKPEIDAMTENFREVYEKLGCASVVLVDGDPSVFRYRGEDGDEHKLGHEMKIPKGENDYKNNEEKYDEHVNYQIQCFKDGLARADCIADDPEVDTLEALETAVAELDSIIKRYSMDKDATNREIVIWDTGLCTTGELDFAKSKLLKELLFCSEWSPEQKAEMFQLVNACSLVKDHKLEDITVTWYGLGQTDRGQEELPYSVKDNLKTIWTAVLKAAGAENPQFEDGNWGRWDPETDFEEVTPIKIPEPSTETRPEVKLPETNKILFKPGTIPGVNEFKDPEAAKATLIEWTEYLLTHDKKIVLVGTTTSEGGDRLERSSDRIQMVIDTWEKLVSSEETKEEMEEKDLRCDIQQVTDWIHSTNPAGNDPKLCVEEDEDFDDENRAVWIFPLDSEEGQRWKLNP